jgi:hypothetical protein
MAGEIAVELDSKLEGFFRKALGGNFHDARTIGIEPNFNDDFAVEFLRLVPGLEQEGRTERTSLSIVMPAGACWS